MLSARGSRELRAAGFALKLAERPVRNAINRTMRAEMNPAWRAAVAERAKTRLEQRVLNTGVRVAPGNPPVLYAAGSRRPLKGGGGLVPASDWHAVEFGADTESVSTYDRRSPRGNVHRVTRHTKRGLPARAPKGRVVYQAAAEMGRRFADLFVQTIVRGIYEAVEEGER